MKETLKKLTVGMIKRGRRPLVIVLLAASAVALAATLWSKKADAKNYITSKIERGAIEVWVLDRAEDKSDVRRTNVETQVLAAKQSMELEHEPDPRSSRASAASVVAGTDGLIALDHVHKIYRMGDVEIHALRSVSLEIRRGEFVAMLRYE